MKKTALEHLAYWAKTDLKILKKIIELSESAAKTPDEGIGKPEKLKGNYKGYYSRRITQEHRIVYEVIDDETISVILCRHHYE